MSRDWDDIDVNEFNQRELDDMLRRNHRMQIDGYDVGEDDCTGKINIKVIFELVFEDFVTSARRQKIFDLINTDEQKEKILENIYDYMYNYVENETDHDVFTFELKDDKLIMTLNTIGIIHGTLYSYGNGGDEGDAWAGNWDYAELERLSTPDKEVYNDPYWAYDVLENDFDDKKPNDDDKYQPEFKEVRFIKLEYDKNDIEET